MKKAKSPLSESATERIVAAGEQAMQSVKAQASEPGQQSAGPKLLVNRRARRVARRSYKGAAGWMLSPAQFLIFKVVDWMLIDCAEANGRAVNEVTHVRLARFEGERKLYIYPTHSGDEDGIEIHRYRGKNTINMYSFLAPDLLIEVGYKERYTVTYVNQEQSPVGVDAILLDMTAAAERKPIAITRSQKTPAKQQATTDI